MANPVHLRSPAALPLPVLALVLAGVCLAQEPTPPVAPPPPLPIQPAQEPGPDPTATPRAFGDIPIKVDAPPPAWIQPGLRLTFHTMAGIISTGGHEFVPDERGNWQLPDGRSFKRQEVHGTGSEGYLQVNVVGMTRETVAVQMLFYLCEGLHTNTQMQSLELGYRAPAGTGGDLWLHPKVIEGLLVNGAPGMVVTRISKTVDQVTHDCVMLFWQSPGGRRLWMYDRESGVLVYSSELTKTGAERMHGGGLRPGGTSARFTTFQASATPVIPWAGQPVPEWVGKVGGYEYRGKISVRQPGMVETPLPFALSLDVIGRGPDWIECRVRGDGGTGGSLTGADLRVYGSHQLIGQWIPPQALAALSAGQEIDRDPWSRFVTRVGHVGDDVVVIVQEGPRQKFEFLYRRRDGLLARAVLTDAIASVPGMTKVLEFELAGTR
jgi:hypothetical protein